MILREKNELKRKNKIFLLKPLFSRKSNLEIYRVYLNLVNSMTGKNNREEVILRAKVNERCRITSFFAFEKIEFENLSSTKAIFKKYSMFNFLKTTR